MNPPQTTPPDQKLLQDLCAWMDGELPADQARFLERRIDIEPALQAQLERWQLASASLRGQRLRLGMTSSFSRSSTGSESLFSRCRAMPSM